MNKQVRSSIISKATQIEGWYEKEELILLVKCIEHLAIQSKPLSVPLNLVEIGNFKGRSTIALGLAVQALNLEAVIYAVDPHKGLRSGKRDKIYHHGDTYNEFHNNLRNNKLVNIVRCIKCKSTETKLDIPISFIHIDGLHLFENVKEDFQHFEKNFIKGCLIAFHDYRVEFPGVTRFVHCLLNSKRTSFYAKVDQVLSLIILKRILRND